MNWYRHPMLITGRQKSFQIKSGESWNRNIFTKNKLPNKVRTLKQRAEQRVS